MIQIHKNALICKLPNRRTYIFKTVNQVLLQTHRLLELKKEEDIEIITKYCQYSRVIRLKNKTLIYIFNSIGFFPDMFELISQTYIPLQQIEYYDTIQRK